MADKRIMHRVEKAGKRRSSVDTSVRIDKGRDSPGSKIKFGSVTISGEKPSAELVQMNVERSTDALRRVTRKLSRPGFKLRDKKDVPRFSADEDDPGIFIRRLNGQMQRGRMVDGRFEVID